MTYSFCLCTRNRDSIVARNVTRLIRHLQKSASPGNYEIVVINNASTDATEKEIKSIASLYPLVSVRYGYEKNRGISFARNAAIRLSRGKLLVFLDDDMYVTGNWYRHIQRAVHTYPDAVIIGGKTILDRPLPSWRWIKSLDFVENYLGEIDNGNRPQKLKSGSLLPLPHIVRRDCFTTIGLYNTRFGNAQGIFQVPGSEDVEFITRALDHKLLVMYCPTIVTMHELLPYKLTKHYFRQQYYEEGKELSRFYFYYRRNKFWLDLKVLSKDALKTVLRMIKGLLIGRPASFHREVQMFFWWGYVLSGLVLLIPSLRKNAVDRL